MRRFVIHRYRILRDVSLKRATAASVPDIASREDTSRRVAIIILTDEIRVDEKRYIYARVKGMRSL